MASWCLSHGDWAHARGWLCDTWEPRYFLPPLVPRDNCPMKAISKVSCHDNLLFENPLGDWPEYDFLPTRVPGQAVLRVPVMHLDLTSIKARCQASSCLLLLSKGQNSNLAHQNGTLKSFFFYNEFFCVWAPFKMIFWAARNYTSKCHSMHNTLYEYVHRVTQIFEYLYMQKFMIYQENWPSWQAKIRDLLIKESYFAMSVISAHFLLTRKSCQFPFLWNNQCWECLVNFAWSPCNHRGLTHGEQRLLFSLV